MDALQKFPPALLAASDKEKLDYFRNDVIVDHPTLTDALKRLDEAANPALDRRILLLVGGTGVGKTAVLRQLVAKRTARQSDQMLLRPELAPAIYVEIEPPDRGAFDFSSFYREGLVAMKASLIDRTVPVVERKTREGMLLTLATENARRNLGRDGLKLRFKNELVSRDVELVAIDEAISFFKTGKGRTEKARLEVLKDQADKLKTFTNKTAATIILAGGFDFFELALTTGQLARRCVVVPMEPYAMTAVGLVGFLSMLRRISDDHFSGAYSRLAAAISRNKSVVGTWFAGRARPGWRVACEISFCFQIPLRDLLAGDETAVAFSVARALPLSAQERHLSVRRRPRARDRDYLKAFLAEVEHGLHPILSTMTAVGQRLEIDPSQLRKMLPAECASLCKALTNRRAESAKRARRARLTELELAIRQVGEEMAANDGPLTRRNVELRLRHLGFNVRRPDSKRMRERIADAKFQALQQMSGSS